MANHSSTRGQNENWKIGRVKTFDSDRGFGFIFSWAEKTDIFFHISKISKGPIFDDDFAVYETIPSRKKPGSFEAINVHPLSKFKLDYNFLAELYWNHDDFELREELVKCLPREIAVNIFKSELSKLIQVTDASHYSFLIDLYNLFVTKSKGPATVDIQALINNFVSASAADEYRIKLWVDGVCTQKPEDGQITSFFNSATQQARLKVFQKISESHKELLVISLLKEKSIINTLEFLVNHLGAINNIQGQVVMSNLNNSKFWTDKIDYSLIEFANKNAKPTKKQMFELFIKGFVQELSTELLFSVISELSTEEISDLFRSKKLSDDIVGQVFSILFEEQSARLRGMPAEEWRNNIQFFSWFFRSINPFCISDKTNEYAQRLADQAPAIFLVNLWELGLFKFLPKKQIGESLWEIHDQYSKILAWFRLELLQPDIARDILIENIKSLRAVKNRRDFYGLLGQTRAILQFNFGIDGPKLLSMVSKENKTFLTVGMWFDGTINEFDFECFKSLLPFFSHEDQIKFLRKVFWEARNKTFDLTIEKLKTLIRIDFDIFKINEEYHPEIPLDISVDIVIEAIAKYAAEGTFLLDNELLKLVLRDLHADKTFKFQIRDLFEECLGRKEAKYNWRTIGTVRKVSFGNDQFYFAIEFKPANEYGGGISDEAFERIKNEIKDIPGRKWNAKENHWGIPSKSEVEVLRFARSNRFFLDFEGSNYSNNTHLADFIRGAIPSGIKFCEGRLAEVLDQKFNRQFWWCGNQPCFENCESLHSVDDWSHYTLLDFIKILGLNVDGLSQRSDRIDNGKYYQFVSLINRFNRLLERLYCDSCGSILSPLEDSNFAHYRAVRFQCANRECNKYGDEIYLHHCLNGKCNGIIDSRISKKCPNGLYICSNTKCGCCCSHSMFERRRANLVETTGQAPSNLLNLITQKKGHLERAEHYCYKCGAMMRETGNDIFECSPCNVKYDVSSNNFKRPNRSFQREPNSGPVDEMDF